MKNLLSIEIRDKSICYVYLKEDRKSELVVDELPLEEISPVAISDLINKLIKEKGFSPSCIFFSLFRKDILIHQLTLPKMTREEAEEVILGEIEKVPAFSEREYEYVYSLFNLDEKRIRIIFSAVPREIIEAIIEGTKATKIPLEGIEIAPLNILNLLYSLSDNKTDEALIVLDDKVSYVMISFKKECRIFYVAGVGLEDFFFKGKIDNLTFVNWIEELKRIFKSYCIEYKKEDIDKIWLIWDEDRAPLLNQLLTKEIKKEVKKIEIAKLINISQEEFNSIYLGTVAPVISYLRNYSSEFHFERFLREIKLQKVIKKGGLFLLIYLAVVGFILGNVILAFQLNITKEKKRLKELENKIKTLEKETATLKKRRDEYLRIKENLLRQAFYVRKLNRISWSKVFGEIAENLPDDVSLSSFSVSESGRVNFNGEIFCIEAVSELMHKINHLSVLENPRFEFLRESKMEGKRIFKFSVSAELRKKKIKDNKDEKKE